MPTEEQLQLLKKRAEALKPKRSKNILRHLAENNLIGWQRNKGLYKSYFSVKGVKPLDVVFQFFVDAKIRHYHYFLQSPSQKDYDVVFPELRLGIVVRQEASSNCIVTENAPDGLNVVAYLSEQQGRHGHGSYDKALSMAVEAALELLPDESS